MITDEKFDVHLYDEEELLALSEFSKFEEYFPSIYSTTKPSDGGTYFDVLGQNITGGTELIELKLRVKEAMNYGDCYIEPQKFTNLSLAWARKNYMPIYINFFGDWKTVCVWYLPEVKNITFHPKVNVNGKMQPRLGLHWNEGHMYRYNDTKCMYEEINQFQGAKLKEKARWEPTTIFEYVDNNHFLMK